jgi:ribose transport system ATP-binding protein
LRPDTTLVRIEGLAKTYPGTRALADVDLDVRAGEVHALLGGNGSGKSTLIKILAGVERADSGGTIEVAGRSRAAERWSIMDSQATGLRFVHQNPGLFPRLSVAENLALGSRYPTDAVGRVRWRSLREHTTQLLARFHVPATPDMPLGLLRPADRTRVAIVRALQDVTEDDRKILVLDEPTSALPEAEVSALLADLRRYAEGGQTIVYVSHRLDEALAIADRVTVLRDGRRAATVSATGLSEERLVELIVGRPLSTVYPAAPTGSHPDTVLELRDVAGGPLRGITLDVRQGEVLGIAGLLGSGRSELLRMIFGAYPRRGGQILLAGRPVQFGSPAEAMAAGIAYLPEDRQADSLFSGMSVRHNMSAAQVGKYFSRLVFRHGRERRETADSVRRFGIRLADDRQTIDTLSGGNQQKVLVARWLGRAPRILLLDEPTQGVDVGARSDIYRYVRQARDAGTAVVLVVSELDELAHACDRVAILRGGRITTIVEHPRDAHQLVELVNRSI